MDERRRKRKNKIARAWYKANPDKARAIYDRKYKKNRKEKLRKNKQWRDNNRAYCNERRKEWWFNEMYVMTRKQKAATIRKQIYCPICKIKLTPKVRPVVDHCHATDNVRGILCNCCNLGLGQFKDSTKALKQAIKYLERN